MKFLVVALVLLLVTGCSSTRIETLDGRVGLRVVDLPEVTSNGFKAWIWLDRPNGRGSIQSVDDGRNVGVEYHSPELLRPDRHTLNASGPVEYNKRVMTIREGEADGYRMAPWGVALLYGWRPNQNRVTQALFGQGGWIVSEDLSTQTVWSIELWGTEVPPRMRVTCVDTGDYLEFTGE